MKNEETPLHEMTLRMQWRKRRVFDENASEWYPIWEARCPELYVTATASADAPEELVLWELAQAMEGAWKRKMEKAAARRSE